MGYIIKSTSGLVNTRMTDTGRQKLSQGNFNIAYFQIGDSEVSYNALPFTYNQADTFILEPSFNAQNSAGVPQSNKENIKYPFYVDGFTGNTYGIPFMASIVAPVYNRAVMRGFFSGNTTAETISWSALTNNNYVVNSNYVVAMNSLSGGTTIQLIYSGCNTQPLRGFAEGDLITIYYDGKGLDNCECTNLPTPTPTPTPSSTPSLCGQEELIMYVFAIGDPVDTYQMIPFASTGTIINGKDSYTSYPNPITIYWNGSEWILDYLVGSTTLSGATTNPFGDFAFNNGFADYSGYTICGKADYLCVEYCDTSCSTFTYTQISSSGNTIWLGNGSRFIAYSASSSTYVLSESNGTIIGTLTGLTENDLPVGLYNPVAPYTAITVSSGVCSNLLTCNCDSYIATSAQATIVYMDCNGERQEVLLNSGETTTYCYAQIYSYILSGSADPASGCTGLTCTGLTMSYADSDAKIKNYFNTLNCLKDLTLPGFVYENKYNIFTVLDPCASPTPTPTPSATFCPTPTPTKQCPPPLPPDCLVGIESCYPMLTYRIVSVCQNEITLDRPTPDYTYLTSVCYARTLIYPPSMVPVYDSATPRQHWNDNVINFESVCYTDESDVKIWNMNIPWSEDLAGLNSALYKGYTEFGSIGYLGSKEYFGYASNSGQTDTDSVYYYNSFGDKITVQPKEQKAIAIIHYTNQTIDFFYGEKFALEPYDPSNPADTTGQARNFKLHIPWVMWHKNPNCCNGETFWVDPPGFDELDLFQVHYLESTKNSDMNNPGIRYYHLWDTNPNINGYPNRVGKVFPDSKIIIIDDEELIAAMSYKANRNWTLPVPRISLITPNTCGDDGSSTVGILTADTEYLYVTYRLSNTYEFTDSLHCNQYSIIQGPNTCLPLSSQNVAVRFGGEFGCLIPKQFPGTTTTTTVYTTTTTTCPPYPNQTSGFFANKFEVICQKVVGDERPVPTEWKIIDFTDQLSATTVNGYITQEGLTGNTFVITQGIYDSAPFYNLNDYIPLTPVGFSGNQLNFGDEYYFYGALETDIQATIYEMRYKVNLGQAEFQASSNPTWEPRFAPYITEIGLYDNEKNLMIISKMQSPVLRQGVQQFLIKFDI